MKTETHREARAALLSLSRLLKRKDFPSLPEEERHEETLEKLQLEMLRIQQGVWHSQSRVILAFEGFDAAGKGGAIRRLTEKLDPRGVHVHPIGPPTEEERGKHWLYRFWTRLPEPGTIAIFDRSWYGRALVEKVERLADPEALRRAHREINEFEAMLTRDGIRLVKIFLGISKEEQYRRFEERLGDPYKFWKLTEDDVRARRRWKEYVRAVDEIFAKNSRPDARWHLVAADYKRYARQRVLEIVTRELSPFATWVRKKAAKRGKDKLRAELRAFK